MVWEGSKELQPRALDLLHETDTSRHLNIHVRCERAFLVREAPDATFVWIRRTNSFLEPRGGVWQRRRFFLDLA
eukprot:jgi/Pico_ML_1/51699/g269.t1